jgi:SAM-dependent methyltransferase
MNDQSPVLAQEREHWEDHSRPYQFYNSEEYGLIISLLSRHCPNGKLEDARILELGCGAGLWTRNLASLGVKIFHFDLSPLIVKSAQSLASPYLTQGLVADMNILPFCDKSFDGVFGSMVLHHASNHGSFGKEVARVLRPGGSAVFHENSARNPLLLLARRTLVGRFGIPRNSSPSEHPLRPREIEYFSSAFSYKRIHYGRMVFFQMAVKYLLRKEEGNLYGAAQRLDDFIYRHFRPLHPLSYYQILEFRA